eukprot:TRINITY_DN7088_c0_g1_i1.p1 TRINITY_DN7088_c0_g1~~TRINITY_DN7088_c0_g1_i1.p1  ORF type:complete len:146 (-),score=3.90 TRINITY_DN7088_c0_g1_i1:594-995(-)
MSVFNKLPHCQQNALRKLTLQRVFKVQAVHYSYSMEDLSTIPVKFDPQLRKEALASLHPKAEEILKYWFGENYGTALPIQCPEKPITKKWFTGGRQVDQEIDQLFKSDVEAVAQGISLSTQRQGELDCRIVTS